MFLGLLIVLIITEIIFFVYEHRLSFCLIIFLILIYSCLDKVWEIFQRLWENEWFMLSVIILPFAVYAGYLYFKKRPK